jgi:hypothetical protein
VTLGFTSVLFDVQMLNGNNVTKETEIRTSIPLSGSLLKPEPDSTAPSKGYPCQSLGKRLRTSNQFHFCFGLSVKMEPSCSLKHR